MRIRRFVCRTIGHAELVRVQGRVGQTKALASLCPRCRTIVALRAATRAERRNAVFGR